MSSFPAADVQDPVGAGESSDVLGWFASHPHALLAQFMVFHWDLTIEFWRGMSEGT